MRTWAQIVDGVAVEVVSLDDALVPGVDVFHPSLNYLECPASCASGWRLVDGDWSPPPAPPAPTAEQIIAYAADKRWRVETGGITVGGVPVATDDRSKTMIMGARIKADADPSYSVGWKGADGSFAQLTAPQIIAISNAVLAHVNACFAAEAAVASAITDGTIATTQQVDDWPWPV